MTGRTALDCFFRPKSVAVIGATDREGSVGRTILNNLTKGNFPGKVYPINPRRPNILGTVVCAVLVGVLLNGLTMLNVPYYTQDFVKGAVLVSALALTFGIGSRR